jgi:hypothetical protein
MWFGTSRLQLPVHSSKSVVVKSTSGQMMADFPFPLPFIPFAAA